MVKAIFLLFAGVMACLGLGMDAAAADDANDDAHLEITLETPAQTPYVQEMVMLRIHGRYSFPVTLETLEQPDLDGFDWMQLGRDNWYRSVENGKNVLSFERKMALYPNRAGEIEIGAFVHALTVINRQGKREVRNITAKGLTLTVQAAPEPEDQWFPTRTISITDTWSNSIRNLKPGQGALRIVTITTVGAKPDILPPMPALEVAGGAAFAHPPHKIVDLTSNGPVTRLFWRWTVRPDGPPTAYTAPIDVHYFDATQRETKTVTIAPQMLSMEGMSPLADNSPAPVTGASPFSPIRNSIGFLGLFLGLAGGGYLAVHTAYKDGGFKNGWKRLRTLQLSFPTLARLGADPDLADLRRAAHRGQSARFRIALHRLYRRIAPPGAQPDPTAPPATEWHDLLARFDRELYGQNAGSADLHAYLAIAKPLYRRHKRDQKQSNRV